MTGIEEKIRQWCAAATVEEAGERVVVVPERDVAEVCRRLHGRARGSFPALGVPDMEDGGNQGTRGIRFLRHTLHGASRHAPPLPA